MGKKPSTTKPISKWPIVLAATGFFLAEVVVLAGAASPFRLPKEAVVLAALSLAVAGGFIAAARRRAITIPHGPLVWVLISLPILQAASALWSASRLRALESSLLTVIWVGSRPPASPYRPALCCCSLPVSGFSTSVRLSQASV